MSALRNVEDTIGGFVERVFGRLFRGHVEPVELARKLAREMEDHKTVSVSRVYVPNEYVIYLSPGDRNRFASFEGSLTTELGVYVAERARHEGFTLLSNPQVRLDTDTDLRVGEYGIACRVVDPPVESPAEVDAATPEPPVVAPQPVAVAPPAAQPDAEPAGDIAAEMDDDDVDPLLEPSVEVPEGVLDEPAEVVEDIPSVDGALDGHGSVPLAPVADELAGTDGPPASAPPVVDVEPVAPALPIAPATPGVDEVVEVKPEPEPVEVPEPEPVAVVSPPIAVEPEPVAAPLPEPVASEPEPVLIVPPVVEPVIPAPPVAVPLPPAARYEPLEGVSGTQIMSAEQARAEGLVAEELHLIVDGRRYPITKRATTIGRSRDCDIVVHDSNASRQHAEIRHIGLDYFVVDANSTNGTIVNGQRIRRHALAHGDRIMIGTTELVVEHTA